MYLRNRLHEPTPAPVSTSTLPVVGVNKVPVVSGSESNVAELKEFEVDNKPEVLPFEDSPVDTLMLREKPGHLFRIFNIKFWFDDIIILALIFLLIGIGELRSDRFLVPILTYIFFGGKEF